jgi:hypothetical protein
MGVPESGPDDLLGAMRSLDEVVASARSFWPGRVMLNRKRTTGVLKVMVQLLTDGGTQDERDATEDQRQAIAAISQLNNSVAVLGYGGRSMWRRSHLDIKRQQLAEMVEAIRDPVTRFAALSAR